MNTPHSSSNDSVCILVVDDHPSTATTLARALSQAGPNIEVISANSGEEALEKVKDKSVDVLITDMMMLGMNGLELIEKMQSHPGGRPAHTMLITAYDVPGLKISAARLKVNEIIIKPVRPERVVQIVSRVIKDLASAPMPVPVTAAPALAEAHSKPKVLIADDMPDNVTLLSRYLENEGYACVTASDGAEALEKVRSELPDMVLLDMNMPIKDGFETLQEIRADSAIAHTPVIIVTAARLEPMDMQMALNMGADDYVTKPFDRRELLARIRTRLRVKEVEDQIRRRNRELNLLPEIGREMSARLDVNDLTTVVLHRVVETLGAFLGHMVLLEPQGPVHKFHYFSRANIAAPALPALEPLLARLNETHQGFIINDTQNNKLWPVDPEDPTRAVMVVPMLGRLGLLGFLALAHEQAGYFVLDHQLLLQAIASQAAIALENARLIDKSSLAEKRLDALLKNAAEPVFIFNADDTLATVSPSASTLTPGLAARQGQRITSDMGAEENTLLHLVQNARETGRVGTVQVVLPNGRMFAATTIPMEGAGQIITLREAVTASKAG